MRDKAKILQNLINLNLYEFLRSFSLEKLHNECHNLRLSEAQKAYLISLHPKACELSKEEFQNKIHEVGSNLFPIKLEESCNSDQEQYFSFLKNKRVVLVGPSKLEMDSNQLIDIESFDCVVRLNFQWPVPPNLAQQIGKRMDVLYHCCNGDYPIDTIFVKNFDKIKFVCIERNIDSNSLIRYCKSRNVNCLDVTDTYKKLNKLLNTAANTGTVAITNLLNSELVELYITGISFFQEPYHEGYRGKGNMDQIHLQAPQVQYCKKLILNDKRVKCDKILKDIIEQ